jgi:hypothetical protein
MPRLMYDSTSPWDIPRDAQVVAGYVDGRYAWPQAWWDMFPNAVHVRISAIGARTAQVGDVEVGCIWPPANAVPWVLRARADGYDPTIYCNELNDWLPVRQAFWAAGVPEPHYWVARYNGVREIPPGSVGRQFAHPGDGDGVIEGPWETGLHFDASWVADFWPGVDKEAPGGGGGSGRAQEMIMVATGSQDSSGAQYWIAPTARGLVKEYVGSTDLSAFFGDQGAHAGVLDQAILDGIINAGEQPPVEVALTPEQLDTLADNLEARLVERLAPLFELAARLKD